MNEPADPKQSDTPNTAGELISADIDCDQIMVVNKDEKTKFVMYKNDTRVFIKGDHVVEKPKITQFKANQFQYMLKKNSALLAFRNAVSQKLGGAPLDYYSDAKYNNVWPFIKTHKNSAQQLCVLAVMDGVDKLVPITDLDNNKTYGIIPVLKVGAIKYHNLKSKWCIGLQLEEIKIETNVTEIIPDPPKVKFVHQL